MPIVPLDQQTNPYAGERKPGMGCHAPGQRRRSGKPLTSTPATPGSKTQKRRKK